MSGAVTGADRGRQTVGGGYVSGARSTDGDACGVGSASYASIMVLVVAALMLVAFARA